MPAGQTMLARQAGPRRLARTMAVVSIPAMLAPALGPVLGGLLLEHLSWRWMFVINVPVCAAALLLAVRLLPADTGRRPDTGLDVLGLIMLSPGLAALVYALARASEGGAPGEPQVLVGLVAGVVLLAAFAGHALRRADRALVDLRLFADRAFATSVGVLFCYSVAMFGALILVPLYVQIVRGGDTLDAGLLVAPLGAGAAVTAVFVGASPPGSARATRASPAFSRCSPACCCTPRSTPRRRGRCWPRRRSSWGSATAWSRRW